MCLCALQKELKQLSVQFFNFFHFSFVKRDCVDYGLSSNSVAKRQTKT